MQKVWALSLGLLTLAGASQATAQEQPRSLLRVETRFQGSPGQAEYPKAKALVLEDDIGFEALADGSTIFTEHDAVKILNEQGVGDHREMLRIYRGSTESIEVVSARTITPDGGVVDVTKDMIVDEPLVGSGHALYPDYRKLQVRFPKAGPGAVTEFNLVTRRKSAPEGRWWATTYVQNPDPILSSTFTVKVPEGASWKWAAPGVVPAKPQVTHADGRDIYHWEVKNSPAQVAEPSMPSPLDTLHRIDITNFESWPQVARWTLQGWDEATRPQGRVSMVTAGLIPSAGTDRQKYSAIVGWLAKKNAIDIPIEVFRPHAAGELVDQTLMSELDLSSLAASMLRFAGFRVTEVPAYSMPAALLERELPRPNRLDRVLLKVETRDGTFWFDPEHPGEIAEYPPSEFQGMAAFVGDKLVDLASSPADFNRQEAQVEAVIDKDGKAEILINLTEFGDTGMIWREAGRELSGIGRAQREETLDRLFDRVAQAFSPRARVHDRYFALGAAQGEPFDISTTLIIPGYAAMDGGKLSFSLPVQPNERLGALAREGGREYPVKFAHPFREDTRVHVVLPPGSRLLTIPDSVQVETPVAQFYATARSDGSQAWYYSRLTIKSTWIGADEFAEFQRVARAALASQASQLVFEPPIPAAQDKDVQEPSAGKD